MVRSKVFVCFGDGGGGWSEILPLPDLPPPQKEPRKPML